MLDLLKLDLNQSYGIRLFDKYFKIKEYSLTVIKSKVLSDKQMTLLNNLTSEEQSQIRYYRINEVVDIVGFWKGIIEVIDLNDSFNHKKADLLDKISQITAEIEAFLIEFSNLLFDLDDKFILVIDNLDLLNKNKVIIESLYNFIEWLPNNIHLVLLIKNQFLLPRLSSWLIKGKAQLIEDEDFILDREEIDRLLINHYSISLTLSELESIYQKTDGWLIAVDLFAQELKKKRDFAEVINDQKIFKAISNYFKDNLLKDIVGDKLSLKEFLIKSSVLEELDVNICNLIFGIDNSQDILEKLKDDSIFIEDIAKGVYRYNSLFRDFLRIEAREAYDYTFLEQQARDAYIESNDISGVLYHTTNYDQKELIDLVINNYEWLIENAKEVLINEFINKISTKTLLKYPEIFLVKGCLYFNELEIEKAMSNYLQGLKLFRKREDIKWIIKSLQKTVKISVFTNSNHFLVYLKQLESYKELFSQEDELIYKELSLLIKIIQGDIKGANKLLEAFDKESTFYQEAKANILFISGELSRAEKYLTYLLDKNKKVIDYYFYNTLVLPIIINSYRGDIFKSQNYIISRLSDKVHLNKLCVFYSAQPLLLYPFTNINIKKDILEVLRRNNHFFGFDAAWHRFEVLIYSIAWEIFYGDLELALAIANEGVRYAKERNDRFFIGVMDYYKGISCYFNGKLEESETIFNKCKEDFIKLDNKLLLCRPLLWSAVVSYDKNDLEEFRYKIKELLKIAKLKNYDFLFLKKNFIMLADPSLFIPLLLKAREEGIEVDYIDRLLAKMELQGLANAPGYSLKVESFGKLKLYRGRKEVKDEEWQRRKSQDLLKVFLLNYGKMLPRELICTTLWPDKSEESTKRNFSVILSSLNKVLQPDKQKREEPFFIRREGNLYGIYNVDFIDYDVAFFEELIAQANQSSEISIKINYYKQAIELYQGDFLIDEENDLGIIKERDRLRKLYIEICQKVMVYYYNKKNYHQVIETSNKILEVNSLYEEAYLYQMKAYKQLGLKGLAVQTYQNCRYNLSNLLEIEPNSKLKRYYNTIKD